MSDAKSPPDLSMDEILAQIRRIIAEDDRSGGPSIPRGATASGATSSAAAASAAAPNAETGSGTDVAAGGAAAGGLDRGAAAADIAGDTDGADDDIVELTEAINEDGSVRHLAPIRSASAEPEVSRPNEPSPSPLPERADTPDPAVTPGGRLVSDAATSAAAMSFSGSPGPREPPVERELPVGAGGRTLEDIVRDLLRPVVQTWLDEHLAEIVERQVQAEIARVGKSGAA
jgi:cell pole-organizing protein PopZ